MSETKKKRKPWRSADLRQLKQLARRKVHAFDIGRKLRRSEGATRQKAHSIGLSLAT